MGAEADGAGDLGHPEAGEYGDILTEQDFSPLTDVFSDDVSHDRHVVEGWWKAFWTSWMSCECSDGYWCGDHVSDSVIDNCIQHCACIEAVRAEDDGAASKPSDEELSWNCGAEVDGGVQESFA